MNTTLRTIAHIVLLLSIGFVAGFLAHGILSPSESTPVHEGDRELSVSVMIDDGHSTPTTLALPFPTDNPTLFDILKDADEKNLLDISYTDYGPGMGALIYGIGGTENTTREFWQYWINNQYASVGPSTYHPNPGDVIFFQLTGNTR